MIGQGPALYYNYEHVHLLATVQQDTTSLSYAIEIVITRTSSHAWILHRNCSNYCAAVQYLLLIFTISEVLKGPIHGAHQLESSTAIQGSTSHRKTKCSTETFAGAIIAGLQYFSAATASCIYSQSIQMDTSYGCCLYTQLDVSKAPCLQLWSTRVCLEKQAESRHDHCKQVARLLVSRHHCI
jgi:hypothetical protein